MSQQVNKIMELLNRSRINMDDVELAFNDASHEERLRATRKFTPALQSRLFDAAMGRGLTLDDIVPPSMGPLEEVIHEGTNTLPAFRFFQKRFCRPSTQSVSGARDVLWGYNEHVFKGFTGPGFYVAYIDEPTGEFWIDYRELPPERPAAWPHIKSNKERLGLLVYDGMIDKMRRVSDHLTIGRAYKRKPMNAWFCLLRKP